RYTVRETETRVMIEEEMDEDGYFRNDAGYAYLFDVPSESPGDDEADGARSRLVVYEDGVPLGPPHAGHEDIRKVGGGRFSHWKDKVYFSTSDNTNPNVNGRRYTVRISKQ
ncbi:MAG: hypothetical protein K8I02_10030, partial [Candidatus Methylomirabilis sp.]|nr:hypothetical protein [Deltaproteobacteria bacterium]